jgi:hypothetical protein
MGWYFHVRSEGVVTTVRFRASMRSRRDRLLGRKSVDFRFPTYPLLKSRRPRDSSARTSGVVTTHQDAERFRPRTLSALSSPRYITYVPFWYALYPVYILLPSNYLEPITRLACFSLSFPPRLQQGCDGVRRRVDLCYPGAYSSRGLRRATTSVATSFLDDANPEHPRESTVPKACNCPQALPIGFHIVTWPIPRGIYCAPILVHDMNLSPTSGQSGTLSRCPAGVVTRSRGIMQLPHNFSYLLEECSRNWEVRRIVQLTPARQDRHWKFVRASRYVLDRIPAALDMDVLLYRFPSECGYCQRLSQLKPHTGRKGQVELSVDLLCL